MTETIVFAKAATINDIGTTFSTALINKLVEDGVLTTTLPPDELAAACAEAGKTIVMCFGTASRSRKACVPCDHPGCSTRPNYGPSGGVATKCNSHKEVGMVNVTLEKRVKPRTDAPSDEAPSDEVLSADDKSEQTPKKRAPRKAEK